MLHRQHKAKLIIKLKKINMKFLFNSRRKFIKNVALGGALSALVPDILAAAPAPKKADRISLADGATILFQGDSITDAGRKKDTKDFNTTGALGSGYAIWLLLRC